MVNLYEVPFGVMHRIRNMKINNKLIKMLFIKYDLGRLHRDSPVIVIEHSAVLEKGGLIITIVIIN